MRLMITVPDDQADVLKREADARTLPVESIIEERITAAMRLDPSKRYVILDQPILGLVEERLGGGHLKDRDDLLNKVSRLARIKFGQHEIKLTPGQMEELDWRSRKMGRTVDQLIQTAYEQFAENFFTLVP